MGALEEFFRDLDGHWRWPVDARIRLRLIGSAALMLQTDYRRGTKDSDVLETTNLTDEIKARRLAIAGKNSPLFERHRVDAGVVPHARLIERFRSAVDVFSYDARASDLPKYIAAFHRAERDYFDVPETEIELPEWV